MSNDLAADLQLIEHPEGGYYREYYRSDTMIDTLRGKRSASTAIYFLLPANQVSHLHRITSDEVWCWHSGGLITLHLISNSGGRSDHVLGPPEQGGTYAYVVPANTWFGATTNGNDTLVSAFVAPGFDFADFELGSRSNLLEQFPQHATLVTTLTV